MTAIKRSLLVVASGCCLSQPAAGLAVNWYVDIAAHESANIGVSWANAWTNFDSVVWGAGGVDAGDTLYLSGGPSSMIYTNTWIVGASGTSNSPIRIAIDATDTNHNGKVVFDYGFAGDAATFSAIDCTRDYISFDGNVNGECHMVISNLRNQWDNTDSVGIYGDTTTGVVIDHVAFTNCNNPIRLQYSTGTKVINCSFRAIRGDAAISVPASRGSWDANIISGNTIELLYNTNRPLGVSRTYIGPDGIQCDDGTSIAGNTFVMKQTSLYTSSQHPDMIQTTGNYLRIYGNEFVNIGDSAIDYDCAFNPDPHDIWIYNNVFRITKNLDPYPEYFRLYASFNSISSIVNLKILNNTFIDNILWSSVLLSGYRGDPIASGNEIKNNIFYNCGRPGTHVVLIANSCGFSSNSFSFDGNIYSHPTDSISIYNGGVYQAPGWVAKFEPHGKTNAPSFVSYMPFRATNDLHLETNDLSAIRGGVDLKDYFATDKDFVARNPDVPWDIGAYAYSGSVAARSELAPMVSAILPNELDADTGIAGFQAFEGAVIHYSCSAFSPDGELLGWQWLYTVNGGGEMNYANGTGAVATVTYAYPSNSAGSQYVWILRASNRLAFAESRLATDVLGRQAVSGLAFEATSGALTAPFIVADGYVYQPVTTGLGDGGRAAYSFVITNEGDYVIQIVAETPGYGQRSLFINVDNEPQESAMVWYLPLHIGFSAQEVSWLGGGTCSSPEFSPKVFHLAAGAHQIIIRGREANVKIGRISLSVVPRVGVVQVTHVTETSALVQASINPCGTPTIGYFDYGTSPQNTTSLPAAAVGSGTAEVAVSNLVRNLRPGTTYYVRMIADNFSKMTQGEFSAFATHSAPVLSEPLWADGHFSVSVPTRSNYWYFLDHRSVITQGPWSPVDRATGDGTTHIMTDLAASNAYGFYNVRVVGMPLVTTLFASNVTDVSALLRGVVTPSDLPTSAYFSYGPTTNYTHAEPLWDLKNSFGEVGLTNLANRLSPGTEYHFQLVAHNAAGTNWGGDLTFLTAPLSPPVIMSPQYQNGQFSLSMATASRCTYYIEYKERLEDSSWSVLTTVEGDGTEHVLMSSIDAPQRFYRLRVVTP